MSNLGDWLFRCDAILRAEGMGVGIDHFPVTKKTPKGVWVTAWGGPKFILDGAGRRFAYPTREQAIDSFMRRKRRQIQILHSNLASAEAQLAFAESGAPLRAIGNLWCSENASSGDFGVA